VLVQYNCEVLAAGLTIDLLVAAVVVSVVSVVQELERQPATVWSQLGPPVMFTPGTHGGRQLRTQLQLWWYPPPVPLIYVQPPSSPDAFFWHWLLLWMPYRMWSVQLACVRPGCSGHHLTLCGHYKQVRQVLDVDSY